MKIASLLARILLGLMFFVFGLNGFLMFIPVPPSLPPLVSAWNDVLFRSHYLWFTAGVQVVCGALLLTNQFVPLALVTLAAVIANILVFHITMMPAGIGPGLLALVLWIVVALPLRPHLAPLLIRKAEAVRT